MIPFVSCPCSFSARCRSIPWSQASFPTQGTNKWAREGRSTKRKNGIYGVYTYSSCQQQPKVRGKRSRKPMHAPCLTPTRRIYGPLGVLVYSKRNSHFKTTALTLAGTGPKSWSLTCASAVVHCCRWAAAAGHSLTGHSTARPRSDKQGHNRSRERGTPLRGWQDRPQL